MQLNVKSEVFQPGSDASRLAKHLGWNRHRAIGMLCDLWHNSQAAEAITATQDEIGAYAGLSRPADQERVIAALVAFGYLVPTKNPPIYPPITLSSTPRSPHTDQGVDRGVDTPDHPELYPPIYLWIIVGNEKHINAKRNNSENQRLRALARWERERKHLAQNMPAADASAVQCSAVQYSAVQRERDPAHAKPQQGEGEQPKEQPRPIETTVDAIAFAVPPAEAKELVEFYRAEVSKHRELVPPPIILPAEMTAARFILAMSSRNMSVAKLVVRSYVLSDREYWKKEKWPIGLLARQRDFETAVQLTAARKL